jgi:predicted lysophospholipase L1 biosynthesis ABC-type transport system permease subunit
MEKMNWFEQPGRWKVSAALAVLSLYFLLWAVYHNNPAGIIINGFALFANGLAFVINHRKRHVRRQIQRQHLIRLTIGE